VFDPLVWSLIIVGLFTSFALLFVFHSVSKKGPTQPELWIYEWKEVIKGTVRASYPPDKDGTVWFTSVSLKALSDQWWNRDQCL